MSRATTTAPGSSSATRYRPISTTAGDPTADCTLKQPVHPQFFCGQLLTDRDLTDLRAWADDRLRLACFRDGWGVACGLEVWTSPNRLDTLTVGPGYALSCCGLDLVVADPTTFDIGRICQPPPSLCEGGIEVEGVTSGDGGDGGATFDVYLRAREQPLNPRPAPRRGCSSDSAGCEYTRAREDIELVALPIVAGPDDVCRRYGDWAKGIRGFLKPFESTPSDGDYKRLRDRALSRKEVQSPPPFDPVMGKPTGADLYGVLLWLVLEERRAFLAELSLGCPSCAGVPGVPLARIRVAPQGPPGKQSCTIHQINTLPPYRRLLHRDDPWATPTGDVNLGPALGTPWLDNNAGLIRTLAARGVFLVHDEEFKPTDVPQVADILKVSDEHDICVPSGTRLTPLVYHAPPLGPIIVGFRMSGGEESSPGPSPTPEPTPAPAPEPTPAPSPTPEPPGS